ncbi:MULTISPECIES: hypothetical protein [unclassified Streptomyces]|uniref:hypothetical protein n=1 Tax=unclassified Streptomyces TaxID=2593676 RepID=UPI000A1D6918|nr:hypothetical protein [Streptomyces sp. 13-12-16]OSP39662.1 hypothetical protein B7767_30480 [Streptomyces sp. 13-12-16]
MTPAAERRTHEGHDHRHQESRGHVAVPRGDHVDHVRDGHIDECVTTGPRPHEGHGHRHGTGCGHVAVPHDGHVDHVHDGHRHAAHEGHRDGH